MTIYIYNDGVYWMASSAKEIVEYVSYACNYLMPIRIFTVYSEFQGN